MNLLAFDLGAESGRAVVGTLDGQRLTLRECHRFANPTARMNGHLFWNLAGQWEQVKIGLRRAAQFQPESAAVDTWGVDFGLLGRGGEILGNPYHYRDHRTKGVMERAIARVGRERIFRSTGVQLMPINTLYQLMAMRDADSSALAAAQTLLMMPDLFNFLLTGLCRGEYTIATTTQMFDVAAANWATPLLEAFELPTSILPQITQPATVLGSLRLDVAAECGLPSLAVVAPASHDTASAVAAVPAAAGQDWAYISSGTWSLMGVEIDRPVVNNAALEANFTNEGGICGKIRFLKNIMGLWLVQECRREFAQAGHEYSYTELTERAEASRCQSLIDPDEPPLLSPGQMPQKIEASCLRTHQPRPVEPGDFIRVCLRSLAETYRQTLLKLEQLTGRSIRMIQIVGGGSQNALLNQLTADACQRTVLAGPVEAAAVGNLLVQAMALGRIHSLDELREVVAASFPLERFEPRAMWQATS
jgi:rhamnulokinase